MRFAPYTKEIDHILVIKCLFENSQNSKITIFGRFFSENCFRWVEFQENPNFHSFILLPSGDHRTTYDGHIRLGNHLWGHLNTRGSSRDLPWATRDESWGRMVAARKSWISLKFDSAEANMRNFENFIAKQPSARLPGWLKGGPYYSPGCSSFPTNAFQALCDHHMSWGDPQKAANWSCEKLDFLEIRLSGKFF